MNISKTPLFGAILVLFSGIFTGCTFTTYSYTDSEMNPNIVVPAWAPPYDDVQNVRYYYLPDIEVFYDVWNQEFVYLQDGNWMFSPTLPPLYSGCDLYDCYVVVLDSRVYEPWMHYHYYVAHYPRYYYRSHYNVADRHELRGFNENRANPIRLKPEDRAQLDEASKNRPEREKVHAVPQEQSKPVTTRPQQPMKYYGKEIGKPVKVEKQMMKPSNKKK
jgi:hypothetical protein